MPNSPAAGSGSPCQTAPPSDQAPQKAVQRITNVLQPKRCHQLAFPGMLSEFSGSPPSIRITEPATPIPVTGWTPFLDHGFLGPFDSGLSKAFQHRCRSE